MINRFCKKYLKQFPSFGNYFRLCSSNSKEKAHESMRFHEFRRKLNAGPTLSAFTEKPFKLASCAASIDNIQTEVFPEREKLMHNIDYSTKYERALLTDKHGRFHNYLRISLTERCNLRCVYCMPPDGVNLQPAANILASEEIVMIVRLFANLGVDKIRLTGGEPTIRKDIVDIVADISALGSVKMIGITTNGINLRHKIVDLKNAGITHINISLDTLNSNKFSRITRRSGLSHVLSSIEAALSHGYGNRLKINVVVMRGINDDELSSFVSLTQESQIDVRFIEWMPFSKNNWNDKTFVSYTEMLSTIRQCFPNIHRLQDGPNDTSKWWQIPGHSGRVAFITSMSDNFCGSCNRLRLTADGHLKTCLFGNGELNLRDMIRAGTAEHEIISKITATLFEKHAALGGHGDMYGISESENRPMILIGG